MKGTSTKFIFQFKFKFKIHLTSILCQLGLIDDPIQLIHNSYFKCFNVFCMTEFRRIRQRNENPTTCRVLKLVSAFVNVNGRDRVLKPGPLSRRPKKSTTTPRSDTSFSSSERTKLPFLIGFFAVSNMSFSFDTSTTNKRDADIMNQLMDFINHLQLKYPKSKK